MDTRSKIQLGGLVVLAGLGEEDSAVLLGLLTSVARELASLDGDAARARYRHVGDLAFKAAEMKRLAVRKAEVVADATK